MLNLDRIRRAAVLCSFLLFTSVMFGETVDSTIHVSGSKLIGVCGDTIVLRGVNYAPYNWGYDSSQLQLNEVAKTGANAVRMTWYANSAAPYYTDALLDSAIGACVRNKMIAILELHDFTCDPAIADIETLVSWYSTPAHVAIFHKYQNSLIINVANEAGTVDGSSDYNQAEQDYQNEYTQLIMELRSVNITVPLMIDAPDCGTSINVFNDLALAMQANDPIQNLIFSTHTYWENYSGNDSATTANFINAAAAYNYPLVFGEVANYQDNGGDTCAWLLTYRSVLRASVQLNLGWLIWSWDNDICSKRQISNDGNYSNLTAYGSDIVNNAVYGLHNTAKPDRNLSNGGSCTHTTAGIENLTAAKPYLLYNDNGTSYLKSFSNITMQIHLFDVLGREILSEEINPGQTISLLSIGMGFVQVRDPNTTYVSKFISMK